MKASGKKWAVGGVQAAQLVALVVLCWGVASMAGRGASWASALEPKAIVGLAAFLVLAWLEARLERRP